VHRVGPVLVAAAALCCGGTPAAPQEVTVLYGIRSNPGVERVPVYPPYHYRVVPRAEPAGAAPRVIEITPGEPSGAVATARPVGGQNPVADLFSDPTLRTGDIAMFTDGPRVFTGAPYGRREPSDFVPAASAGRMLPAAIRDYVLSLRPAWSGAWERVEVARSPRPEPSRIAPRPFGFEVVRVAPPR
jgi:hypothetical protein